ncbi:MAG: polysaccharide export protein EpsE [Nitrosospira sp.]|nr:polysaccharide export protein EpsE [Nitrosospira sp.]
MTQALIRTLILFLALFATKVAAGDNLDYPLGAGDVLRIQVFQNPDLTTETRVSENGSITYPLIGDVEVGGLPIASAEKKIAAALKDGGFVKQPQVNIILLQMRGSQVSVFGQVNRPGRFPLETLSRVSDMLAIAGGVAPTGDDVAIVTGSRNGKPFRRVIDIPALYLGEGSDEDMILAGGDVVYVHRAPVFYIYGEAQRPGAYRIERGMTIMQALAQGGGPTLRGSEWRLRLHRQNEDGDVKKLSPKMTDAVQPNDILYVRESIF